MDRDYTMFLGDIGVDIDYKPYTINIENKFWYMDELVCEIEIKLDGLDSKNMFNVKYSPKTKHIGIKYEGESKKVVISNRRLGFIKRRLHKNDYIYGKEIINSNGFRDNQLTHSKLNRIMNHLGLSIINDMKWYSG